ncbi:hypothetical protein IPH92_04990 [Candidatus Kaiserbacteria bacterium]|nr:MAG: hypothetical protein IPH92_04990 [Candidatus Kaiserbacteria bacterium]
MPVNEDSEEAVAANTLPVTLDGEVVQNQAPDTQDFVEGDSDIEDAVILSETPRSNIGKEQVQKPAALTSEILKDEKVKMTTSHMLPMKCCASVPAGLQLCVQKFLRAKKVEKRKP